MDTLLISSVFGGVWLLLLFGLCFLSVHVVRLAQIGQAYRKQLHEEKPKQEQSSIPQPVSQKPETVYYIVERKKRVKNNFDEPKQIRFQ